jgi:uncharacterized protein
MTPKGTWALVTGASSGIGADFARQLAARGMHLVLTARSEDKLVALGDELTAAHGITTRVIAHDLGAVDGASSLWQAVSALGNPMDLVVNNAGFGLAGRLAEQSPAELVQMVRLNCEALLVLSRLALPSMIERRSGGIINVASTASFQPVPYLSAYAASKAFVRSLSAALAEEVRDQGVRVMALCPGPVRTGFQERAGYALRSQEQLAELSSEETVRRGLEAYDRGREVFVPGAVNQATSIAGKLTPSAILVRSVGRMMRGRAK